MKKQFLGYVFVVATILSIASCGSKQMNKECLSGHCHDQKIESLKAEDIKLGNIIKDEKNNKKKVSKKGNKNKKLASVNRLK